MKYMKLILAVVGAGMMAAVAALSGDGVIDSYEKINIAIAVVGAASVFAAPNVRGAMYTKFVLSALSAVLVFLTSAIAGGISTSEWFQIGVIVLTSLGVYSVPNSTNEARSAAALRALVPLFICASLISGSVACGPPSKKTIEKLHTGSLIVFNELTFNASLPDDLLAEKIINAVQYEKVKSFMAQALSAAGSVEHGLAAALMVEKPSIASLALGVADIIANLRGLTSLVNNERVQKMFAAVQLGLRVLGSYFALQISKLRAAGFSDRQICEGFDAPYDKGRFGLLANAYDGARFDEWAAAL